MRIDSIMKTAVYQNTTPRTDKIYSHMSSIFIEKQRKNKVIHQRIHPRHNTHRTKRIPETHEDTTKN